MAQHPPGGQWFGGWIIFAVLAALILLFVSACKPAYPPLYHHWDRREHREFHEAWQNNRVPGQRTP